MSYKTVQACAVDQSFLNRLTAALGDELNVHDIKPEPTLYLEPFRWSVASASDIEAAYASALAGENPDPGGDESVITDQMILSAIQAHWDQIMGPGNSP